MNVKSQLLETLEIIDSLEFPFSKFKIPHNALRFIPVTDDTILILIIDTPSTRDVYNLMKRNPYLYMKMRGADQYITKSDLGRTFKAPIIIGRCPDAHLEEMCGPYTREEILRRLDEYENIKINTKFINPITQGESPMSKKIKFINLTGRVLTTHIPSEDGVEWVVDKTLTLPDEQDEKVIQFDIDNALTEGFSSYTDRIGKHELVEFPLDYKEKQYYILPAEKAARFIPRDDIVFPSTVKDDNDADKEICIGFFSIVTPSTVDTVCEAAKGLIDKFQAKMKKF